MLDNLIKLVIVLTVAFVVFGPDRLPDVARQLGRFVAAARRMGQEGFDTVRREAALSDIAIPDLKIGSLRNQAGSYVRDLLDLDGHREELARLQDFEADPAPIDPEAT